MTPEDYPNNELHEKLAAIAAMVIRRDMTIVDLKQRIAKLEAENAYLESIKDPLRDNIGWSPVSDLTFD